MPPGAVETRAAIPFSVPKDAPEQFLRPNDELELL
jgi:hypothetical protein